VKRLDLYKLAARILLAWTLLSAAGILWGRHAVELLIPFLTATIEAVSTSYTPLLEYRSQPDGDKLLMTAYVTQPIYVHSALTLNPGAIMTVGIDELHVLVPLVILFTALLAWPVGSWRERVLLVAFGLPSAFIVSGLTVPFLLAGKIEMMLSDYAAQIRENRSSPVLVSWMIFGESGGRWLIPLVTAALCGLSIRSAFDKNRSAAQRWFIGRSSPRGTRRALKMPDPAYAGTTEAKVPATFQSLQKLE